jgi:hypothetical protein
MKSLGNSGTKTSTPSLSSSTSNTSSGTKTSSQKITSGVTNTSSGTSTSLLSLKPIKPSKGLTGLTSPQQLNFGPRIPQKSPNTPSESNSGANSATQINQFETFNWSTMKTLLSELVFDVKQISNKPPATLEQQTIVQSPQVSSPISPKST